MLLTTDSLAKNYRRGPVTVHALTGVSLEIAEGSFVAVTGPSGSGKTTLLLTLAGLLQPTSGRITFRGKSLESQSDAEWAAFRRRNLGFVMQNFSLVPYLDAQENVALSLAADGVGSAVQRRRSAELLERVGLADRARHLPRELSAGQQQRVAIARALAASPALVLADEPTGNLDPALARDVLRLLQALNREDGMAILMVTHSPEAAEAGSARLHMEGGRLVSASGTAAIRGRPVLAANAGN